MTLAMVRRDHKLPHLANDRLSSMVARSGAPYPRFRARQILGTVRGSPRCESDGRCLRSGNTPRFVAVAFFTQPSMTADRWIKGGANRMRSPKAHPMRSALSPRLQHQVDHATRFVDALRRVDRDSGQSPHFDPRTPTDAERWIVGRAGEVTVFVADVLVELRGGLRHEESAAALIEGFIASMHSDFALTFGYVMSTCCVEDKPAAALVQMRSDSGSRSRRARNRSW